MCKSLFFVLPLIFSINIITAQAPDISILQVKAPQTFRAVFKTTKGEFVIEAYRKWSPMGVDRLYQLIATGFFNHSLLFRVEPNFLTQFGISANYYANRFWDPKKLPDEPMLQKNMKGMIAYARGGKNGRSTQLFINSVDNPKLDTAFRAGIKGYTPIAKVIRGMEIVHRLNGQYGKKPAMIQDSLYKYGNFYFEERFPELDKIITVRLIK